MTTAHWAQESRGQTLFSEAAVMISAPWLHHSTSETPGGLIEASWLPAKKVPYLTRGWTALSEPAPRRAVHFQSAPHRQAAERLPPALSATLWTGGFCTAAGEPALGSYPGNTCFTRALQSFERLSGCAVSAIHMEFRMCCPQHRHSSAQGYG